MVAHISTKTCCRCKKTYPLNQFVKDTFKCKSCKSEENLAYRLKNRLSLKETPLKKFCGHCNTVKASCEFYKSTSTRDGLQYHCIKCSKELISAKTNTKYNEALKQVTPPLITLKQKAQIQQIKQLAREMSVDVERR